MSANVIDDVMPAFDVRSFHATRVAAPREVVYRTARHGRIRGSWVIDALMAIRSLPSRFRGRARGDDGGDVSIDDVIRSGFALVAERPNESFVLGIAGRFWTLVPETVRVDASTFGGFHDERYAKAAWSFSVTQHDGGTMLSTETRVLCPTPRTRARFLWYWRLIAPFSGVIRMQLLNGMRRAAEERAHGPAAS